jgi:hypothetical protein
MGFFEYLDSDFDAMPALSLVAWNMKIDAVGFSLEVYM